MPTRSELVHSGISPQASGAVCGIVNGSLTATGTTQADALALASSINVVTTTGANTGVVLPTGLGGGESVEVSNLGASTLKVYPPVGGKINAGSTNAALSVATLKSVKLVCIDNLNFYGILSA